GKRRSTESGNTFKNPGDTHQDAQQDPEACCSHAQTGKHYDTGDNQQHAEDDVANSGPTTDVFGKDSRRCIDQPAKQNVHGKDCCDGHGRFVGPDDNDQAGYQCDHTAGAQCDTDSICGSGGEILFQSHRVLFLQLSTLQHLYQSATVVLCTQLRSAPRNNVVAHNAIYSPLVVRQRIEVTGIDFECVAVNGFRCGFDAFQWQPRVSDYGGKQQPAKPGDHRGSAQNPADNGVSVTAMPQ